MDAMKVFKIPVSVAYFASRGLLIGAISASPVLFAQKKDSLKEKIHRRGCRCRIRNTEKK
jgi:hypothetical protein